MDVEFWIKVAAALEAEIRMFCTIVPYSPRICQNQLTWKPVNRNPGMDPYMGPSIQIDVSRLFLWASWCLTVRWKALVMLYNAVLTSFSSFALDETHVFFKMTLYKGNLCGSKPSKPYSHFAPGRVPGGHFLQTSRSHFAPKKKRGCGGAAPILLPPFCHICPPFGYHSNL